MRVAIVTPGGVDRSGTTRVVPALIWLIERVARAHEVTVFALAQEPRPSTYALRGAVVRNIGHGWTRPRAVAAIVREHLRRPFDVIHAFWAGAAGTVAASAGWLLGRPTLLHLAGGELVAFEDIGYGGRLTWRGRLTVRICLRGATCVTAASEPMLAASARLGHPALRLPLGVDRMAWPVRAPRPRDASRPARLLHVADQNHVKDQATLVRALAWLAAAGLPYSMDIAGGDVLNGEVQRAVSAQQLSDRVTFHGYLSREQLRPLYDRADVLLVSSRHEAGPVVALEAALAGVPTVGTAVGHVAEWAPEAAVAVPVGDGPALGKAVLDLLADDSRRVAMATAAQSLAIAQDADWTAAEVMRLYSELSDARR